ncbi:MAG: lipid II:glycine glycyltransferase FemX [Oligoflexales bacterium]
MKGNWVESWLKKEDWNELCKSMHGHNIYHSYQWGIYKEAFGWQAVRFLKNNKVGEPIAAVQLLIKKGAMGLVSLLWCPGGILGQLNESSPEILFSSKIFSEVIKPKYIRISFQKSLDASDYFFLHSIGWKPAYNKISSGMSFLLKKIESEEIFLQGCTSNWRHNYRRGTKKNTYLIEEWLDPNPQDMWNVYEKMEHYKGLKRQYSKQELVNITQCLRPFLVMCRAIDSNGTTVAFRGAAIFGNQCLDFFAAASPEARKSYTSHLLLVKLLQICRSKGGGSYDLGGIDPLKAPGVYNFKKGTGADPVVYLGEWEWASSKFCMKFYNQIINWRFNPQTQGSKLSSPKQAVLQH